MISSFLVVAFTSLLRAQTPDDDEEEDVKSCLFISTSKLT